jgi:aspartyl-tRNA(Asn)/glutamyl-tRNA(Gln) amidotransferase subunit A
MVASELNLAYLTATELGARFRARELSPVELTTALLERAERLQPSLRAFVTMTPEIALAEARAAEAALLAGDARPLLGVPVGYKDIYFTAGIRTTAGSELHLDNVPETTATTVQKLHDAGMVMLGKLATNEFAAGLSPMDHPLPPPANPWNAAHFPGGSSSGSGTALAAGLVAGALGTDTGGSIRNPASYCGLAGLKPTYGRCSRYGVFPLSWTLDHTGPLARSVADCALMMNALAGYDALDPASAAVPTEDYTAALDRGVTGLRVGVLRSWYTPDTNPEVAAAVDAAVAVLGELGAVVSDVTLPSVGLAPAYHVIAMSEAYAYHAADLRETPEKFALTLRNRLLSGALYQAHEYVNAQRARQILIDETAALLREVDVLVTPANPTTAPTFEQSYAETLRRGASYSTLFNLTGLPALVLPCGFDDAGLPIGLQVAGRPFAEATVLRAGHAYQRATDWHTRHPNL